MRLFIIYKLILNSYSYIFEIVKKDIGSILNLLILLFT